MRGPTAPLPLLGCCSDPCYWLEPAPHRLPRRCSTPVRSAGGPPGTARLPCWLPHQIQGTYR